MVNIFIKKENDVIKSIKVSGHAMYDIKGKDIVCAAVSSMLIVTVNAILEFDKNSIDYKQSNEFNLTNLKKDDVTNKLLNNLVNHLKELELKYKENIQIKEE